jgi:2-polyprenyl-6-hydroxyphenyl methylase/3-demethylubiquinone-9 3-methyltransferase
MGLQPSENNPSHQYLLPALLRDLAHIKREFENPKLFELGCGNGAIATRLTQLGYDVTGIDLSEESIGQANRMYPWLKLNVGSAYDDLAKQYGQFPIVVSLEVIEHVYYPRKFASTVYNLLKPGGTAIISTPYHGYCKNLALAALGRMDQHLMPLTDYGHIKFWSMKTLRTLLTEVGFKDVSFHRVGRIPIFAKSMIAVVKKGETAS